LRWRHVILLNITVTLINGICIDYLVDANGQRICKKVKGTLHTGTVPDNLEKPWYSSFNPFSRDQGSLTRCGTLTVY